MSSLGRPTATGRSSGKRRGRAGEAHRPPKGEPFVWLTRELLTSPAWRNRSVNTIRLLDFLMVEHMNHAGTENGNLKATHEQLRAYGLSANSIRDAIEEAEFLGLIRFTRGGRWASSNQPSLFRLTFQADRDDNPPTNQWKRRSEEQIHQRQKDRKARRKGRKIQKATRKTELPYSQN